MCQASQGRKNGVQQLGGGALRLLLEWADRDFPLPRSQGCVGQAEEPAPPQCAAEPRAVPEAVVPLLRLSRRLYSCILLDEAQDANAAVLSVLQQLADSKTRVVLVGDPNQGTTDFLAEWSGTAVFQLTNCFRYGPEVVHVANQRLRALGSERLLRSAAAQRGVREKGGGAPPQCHGTAGRGGGR